MLNLMNHNLESMDGTEDIFIEVLTYPLVKTFAFILSLIS